MMNSVFLPRFTRIRSIILLVFFLPILITAQEIEQSENLNNKEESIWITSDPNSKLSAGGFFDDGATAFINGMYVNNKNNLAKVFHIDIQDPGDYFLSAFALGYNTSSEDGSVHLTPIQVKIDGDYVGELDLQLNGWQSSKLKGGKGVFLNSGKHKIEFITPLPYYPAIDAVKLSSTSENNRFDMSKYQDFISVLKDGMEAPKIAEKSEQFSFREFNKSKVRSASNATDNWTVNSYTLSNPLGNYRHLMTVPVTYTFYRKLYLNSNVGVTFETQVKVPLSCSAVDPVMYLFKEDDINQAWSNDDGGCGLQSELSAFIRTSGNYYLVIRAYSSYYSSTTQGYQGLVDVYQNG